VAVERLANVVSHKVLCMKASTGWEIHVVSDMTMDPLRKSKTVEALAFLADIAYMEKMQWETVYEKVKWTGTIPSQGLSAWQEAALRWLRWGTMAPPEDK
jgi:hypothetical protein